MSFPESALRWQRWLLAAMLFGSAVIIWPAALEPVMLPKITFLVMAGVALVGLSAARAIWLRQVGMPVSPAAISLALFGVALVVVTVTSPSPWVSLIGVYSRYTGLAAYLTYLTVFLVALRVTDRGFIRLLLRTGVVALGTVVAYGLLQAVGLDPVAFRENNLGQTFSFFGNVNFSAAWAGAVGALCFVVALSREESRGWRIAAAVLLPVALLYVVLTGTSQGPIVALVALGTAAAIISTGRDSLLRRTFTSNPKRVLIVAAAFVVLTLVASMASLPFLRTQLQQSLVERPDFWAAAWDIFRDHPVLGTGLDTYAHHFLAYRPASHALAHGAATTDAPHSVPLAMLSNGGLVLALPYLAFVVLVGAALVRGAMRLQGEERVQLAGMGGVWTGYQVQSLISFDVPPLALLHFLSAAVIVVLGMPPRWRTVILPGAPVQRPAPRKGRQPSRVVVPASARALLAGVAVVAVAMLWLAAYPIRADLVAASAAPLTERGQYEGAVRRFDTATDLNPAEAAYPFLAARGSAALQQGEAALAWAAEAARRDPGAVQYPMFAARVSVELGDEAQANRWYREAVERDPRDVPVLKEAAEFFLTSGDADQARQVLESAVALRADPDAVALLERARAAAGA